MKYPKQGALRMSFANKVALVFAGLAALARQAQGVVD
jgi:hypothetical protein